MVLVGLLFVQIVSGIGPSEENGSSDTPSWSTQRSFATRLPGAIPPWECPPATKNTDQIIKDYDAYLAHKGVMDSGVLSPDGNRSLGISESTLHLADKLAGEMTVPKPTVDAWYSTVREYQACLHKDDPEAIYSLTTTRFLFNFFGYPTIKEFQDHWYRAMESSPERDLLSDDTVVALTLGDVIFAEGTKIGGNLYVASGLLLRIENQDGVMSENIQALFRYALVLDEDGVWLIDHEWVICWVGEILPCSRLGIDLGK